MTPLLSLPTTSAPSLSSRRIGSYVTPSIFDESLASLSRQSRAIHSSSRSLKDSKRWVNAAGQDGKEGKSEEATEEEKKSELKEDIEKGQDQQAESSKAAQERAAKAQIDKADSESTSRSKVSASSSADAKTSSSGVSNGSGGGGGNDGSNGDGPKETGKEIAKLNVPAVFPQVLALPITHRPLFPTFYKAVTITHPPVIKAIKELLAHGQPYLGAFLFKDPKADADVITSVDQVHPVGVFAQITSTFESSDRKSAGSTSPGQSDKAENKDEQKALTVVLYPHRRIRIDELVTSPQGEAPSTAAVNEVQKDEGEAEVSSFEPGVPTVDSIREELGTSSDKPGE